VAKVVLATAITLKVILGSNPFNLLLVSKLDPSLSSHHNVSTGLETMFVSRPRIFWDTFGNVMA
jgi:hypothetical protein